MSFVPRAAVLAYSAVTSRHRSNASSKVSSLIRAAERARRASGDARQASSANCSTSRPLDATTSSGRRWYVACLAPSGSRATTRRSTGRHHARRQRGRRGGALARPPRGTARDARSPGGRGDALGAPGDTARPRETRLGDARGRHLASLRESRERCWRLTDGPSRSGAWDSPRLAVDGRCDARVSCGDETSEVRGTRPPRVACWARVVRSR